MSGFETTQAEFLSLGFDLKRCRGEEYEDHDHPAVLVDRATSSATRVWGWWTETEPRLPCILWSSKRGWSVAVVEPDAIGAPGYELAYWSHRVKLLDLALANAIGPYRTLETLELYVTANTTIALGDRGSEIKEALLWGIFQSRSVRASRRGQRLTDDSKTREGAGNIDYELASHRLAPTIAKPRKKKVPDQHKDAAANALVRELASVWSRQQWPDSGALD